METELETTPRKYPLRARKKVKYYDEFETSMENESKPKKNAKGESDFEDEEEEKENDNTNEIEEDDVEEEISEYEKLRLKNLEENRRVMMELGLIDPMKELKEKEKLKAKKPKPKVKTSKPLEPRKRSLRLLKKTPDGKDLPFDIFQETPSESPTVVEEQTRIEEEMLPMSEDGESVDFLDSLKATLSQDSGISSQKSTDSLIKDMRDLQFAAMEKTVPFRIQGMCVHPVESKILVVAGNTQGDLGLWNVSEGVVAQFKPHLRAINCISASVEDHTKLFTTSHDGTVRRADVTKSVFELVYQTTEKTNMCHITWHCQTDNNTLMVSHGTGDVGVVDLRTKRAESWFKCHHRSVRTVQQHPTEPHYFITSSGIGEIKIWDVRENKKHVGEFVLPRPGKGLTSAFFSPDGTKVVSTCNDDSIRIHDTTDVTKPREIHRMMHDNHTGRWLSVFKAIWHPLSSDLIFIGSMLQPRRIQLYSGSGRLLREVMDERLSTIVPVLSLHPSLPVLVGGNSTGKAHVFTTPELQSLLNTEYLL